MGKKNGALWRKFAESVFVKERKTRVKTYFSSFINGHIPIKYLLFVTKVLKPFVTSVIKLVCYKVIKNVILKKYNSYWCFKNFKFIYMLFLIFFLSSFVCFVFVSFFFNCDYYFTSVTRTYIYEHRFGLFVFI